MSAKIMLLFILAIAASNIFCGYNIGKNKYMTDIRHVDITTGSFVQCYPSLEDRNLKIECYTPGQQYFPSREKKA